MLYLGKSAIVSSHVGINPFPVKSVIWNVHFDFAEILKMPANNSLWRNVLQESPVLSIILYFFSVRHNSVSCLTMLDINHTLNCIYMC